MEIIDNIKVEISPTQVLKRLHMDQDDKYLQDVEKLLELALPVLCPKAIFDIKYIDSRSDDSVTISGVEFSSRILRVNLDKVERTFPYIATCGIEVEKLDIPADELMLHFMLDTIKQMALGEAMRHLRQQIDEKYRPGKMSAMNPGSLEDWPISEQHKLFSLFGDVEKLIGVKLTDSCLMMPIKSVSGLYFQTETDYVNCQLCPREKCPGRRAPYNPELKEEYLK
ncbi:vitamin B12 dependent methionine synthase [Candidatus Poribacteria bacterium]|nr:vitamin B12 dependent methionine synthase [Candidatus Poribacteria bacterium]